MRLYHCGGSRGLRALWTIEEIGLECELVALPFPPRRQVPGYLDLNPAGTVPTLVDGDVVMTESSAIAEYLAARYAPDTLAVRIDEPDYGPYLDYLHHADATLTFPQTIYLRYAVLEPNLGLQQAGELYADWFGKRLAKVSRRLETRRFLCADRFTVADIAIAYAILLARKHRHRRSRAAATPRLVRYPRRTACLSPHDGARSGGDTARPRHAGAMIRPQRPPERTLP